MIPDAIFQQTLSGADVVVSTRGVAARHQRSGVHRFK